MLRAPNGDPVPRVLTSLLARRLGYSTGKIRTELRLGRWEQLVTGIYLTRGDLPTRADWIRAGLYLAGPGAVLSGWDALQTRGLGSRRPPTDTVLILATSGTHRLCGRIWIRPSRREVRCSHMPIQPGGTAPVAHVARAVADTALMYRTLAPVRALVTTAVQKGLCTAAELQRELDTGPRNGSAHLRRAIEDVFGGAASISEAELAEMMRAAGLPAFELNVPILDHLGNHIATADALWRELRAILEVDSREHHFLEPQWRGTMRRHNKLSRHALAVTHYPPAEFRDQTVQVMDEIDEWLRVRAAELGVPYPPAPATDRGTPFRLPPLPLSRDQQGVNVA